MNPLEWQLDQIETLRHRAILSLQRCCTPLGLEASGQSVGHHQIWARDTMIASLGARLAQEEEIQLALTASVALLRDHSGRPGLIPNNVSGKTQKANYRAYADGGLWWIIGASRLAADAGTIRSVLRWYECQDVDQSGLLSMQEGSDWQDLFCTRGKGLYLNCVYVLALRAAAKVLAASHRQESDRCLSRAERVGERINAWLWYQGDGNLLRHISHSFSTEAAGPQDFLGRERWIPNKRYLVEERYYLPYLGFRAAGEWFDSFGNILAILAGVADEQQSNTILDFIARHSLDRWPLRSLTPCVKPGDPDWRDYYGSLNTPHRYHNGGVWPFIGGFYVAALVQAGRRDDALSALQRLAELNEAGEFNEWHHGESGEPMGAKDQAWSAGMYLFAVDCVRRGRVEIS